MNFDQVIWRIRDMIETRDPMVLVLALMVGAMVLLVFKMISVLRGPRELGPVKIHHVDPRELEVVAPARTRKSRPGKYEFYICLVGDQHKWVKVRNDAMIFKHKVGNKEISIETKDLYEIEPGTLARLRMRMKGIKSAFIVVFDKKGEPIGYQPAKRSAYLLKTVQESRALSKALRDEFKQAIEGKTLFMYIILIVVAIVAYLVITGQLKVL